MAHRYGLTPGIAVDLRTGWNLNSHDEVNHLWELLKQEKPVLIIGSPGKASREGMLHLKVMCEIYEWQHKRGGLFLHEHRWHAPGWGSEFLKRLLKIEGIDARYRDRCASGSAGTCASRADWVANNARLLEAVDRPYDGTGRSPEKLVKSVLSALRSILRDHGMLNDLESGGPTAEEKSYENDPQFQEFWDRISGEKLDSKLVHEGRKTEVKYMKDLKVYREATEEEMKACGAVPIPTQWIDVNKGDADSPLIRCRLVAMETRRRTTGIAKGPEGIAATFAATPPLEGVRLILSLAMSQMDVEKDDDMRVVGFYDISRAHFHAPARRDIFIRTPMEDTENKTGLGKLLQSMYGTRDAAQCFDVFAEESMNRMSFRTGIWCPLLLLQR